MKHFLPFFFTVFFTTLLIAQKTSYDLPVGYDRANHEYTDEAPEPFSDHILPEGTRTMRSDFSEGFDDIDLLPPLGWALINNSDPLGISGWFQGNPGVFPAHSGDSDSYIGANFNNTAGVGTISNWLLTPEISMSDGDVITFWTRTVTGSTWADRLQLRLSTNGNSTDVGTLATDVGDFATLLLDINPSLISTGYPQTWTQYSATLSGIGEDVDGRIAFRYFVTNGGPSGSNSNYIGIDTFSYQTNGEEPPPVYCDAGPTNLSDSNVERVLISGENDTEIDHLGCFPAVTGVENLTELSVDLTRGETYTLEVTFGTCGGNFAGAGSVWIDWGQDFVFDPADLIHESTGTPGSGPWDGPVAITFTVPLDAELGNTVMRVMQWEDSFSFPAELPLDPCGTFIWGSVMDFGIIVLEEPIITPPGTDCTDPIVVDAFPFQDLGQTTCGMENTYSNTCLGNYDTGEDIHYRFTLTEEQLVTITMDPKGSGWTGMLLTDVCPPPGTDCIATNFGSSGVRQILEVLEPGTYYIMISTWPSPVCIPDFDLTITTEDPPPYCLGGPTSPVDSNVENVFIAGENDSEIDHDGVCPGITGVEDLTHLSVDLTRGETYTLEVTFGSCGTSNWFGAGSVWIDWGQDFEFDPADLIHESTGTPGSGPWDGPVAITFTVPLDAELGNTVMRVMQWENSTSFPAVLPLDPCGTFFWGSVMDFSVNVLEEDDDPVAVPVSNWAIFLGILLMISFVMIRFRRMI